MNMVVVFLKLRLHYKWFVVKLIGRLHIIGTTHVHWKKILVTSFTKKCEVKPCDDEFERRVQKLAKGGRSHGHNNQPWLHMFSFALVLCESIGCVQWWGESSKSQSIIGLGLGLEKRLESCISWIVMLKWQPPHFPPWILALKLCSDPALWSGRTNG